MNVNSNSHRRSRTGQLERDEKRRNVFINWCMEFQRSKNTWEKFIKIRCESVIRAQNIRLKCSYINSAEKNMLEVSLGIKMFLGKETEHHSVILKKT